jgi:non-specific serine/threonine protein kinase
MPEVPEGFARSVADRYRIERELGRGGMATVYLAEDLKHRRWVAIKLLNPEVGAEIGPERFRREIEIAARLAHPHIVALHDSGIADHRLFYVMPYIEGESLRAKLDRDGRLPLADALRLAREIASALGYAHRHGLIHRDIKPGNVLLSDGMALVADFGVARVTGAEDTGRLTSIGTTLGTPAYMAPEQISASGEIDGRADIYSLGCLLYELLAGQPPFSGTFQALVHQHLCVAPRPVTDWHPEVPPGVAAAIAKSLAKQPADRHATAASFAEALTTDGSLAAATLLPGSVVAPATPPSTMPNNLPAERTRFIGREKELADCARLLEDARLLTLTGIGGAGKTRLALRLAAGQLDRHPDGVWLVDLAPLADAVRVPEALAAVLGVREAADRSMTEMLGQHLRGKRVLLVLDNCEHLLAACAQLADALLSAGEGLRILATSREGLGVEGERLFALQSLDAPAAVSLFVERARQALHEFELGDEGAAAVGEICRRLDGIPLAIELAAARVKMLSVEQIRAKLDDRFRLLADASKTAPSRHQTLRATIQWSYDQLPGEEQRLFRALSVFAGGWRLDSAARVAGDQGDELEVLDLLSHLVDKSLVLVDRERSGGEPRYSLLETVRQYGLERLTEAGEAQAVRQRHVTEFLALAERAYAERLVREEVWAAALAAEHDNLRAALSFLRQSDTERYLELAGALAWFWQVRSHLIEGREHLTAALAATAPEPVRPARARALWGIANTAAWQGDAAAARPEMEEALRIWRQLGDLREVALALEGIGWAEFLGGEDEAACATFEECLRVQRAHGDPPLVNRAMVALAQVLVALARVDEARPMATEIIAYARSHDDRRSEHFGWHYLADCALIEGKCDESLALYRQSLVLAGALGDRLETSFEIQGVAMSLAGLGNADFALRLAAAARAEWERMGVDIHMRFWDALQDRYLGGARQALGAGEADRNSGEGKRLAFDEAIALALDGGRAP